MRRGDHRAAWQISDAVLAARDAAARDDPALPYHQRWVWDGRPLDGRAVTVRCYHGLGDTIQFAQFIPMLAARAASVTVEVQPELLRLIDAQDFAVRLLPFDPANPLPPGEADGEADVEIMELSHALRSAPSPMPYLKANAARRGGVGICWQASPYDPARSIDAASLAPILPPGSVSSLPRTASVSALPRTATVSLQPHAAPFGWADGVGDGDVLDTARCIAGLSLVVSVDTMVAHLAAALGRPTCLLLKSEADWRWGEGSQVDWYGTVRPLRQTIAGDWTPVLAALSDVVRAVDHGMGVA